MRLVYSWLYWKSLRDVVKAIRKAYTFALYGVHVTCYLIEHIFDSAGLNANFYL